ncbi:protein-tyrosine phosphatase family protein [Stieleria maiorica]|uniref:cytochrome c n=1 Tax=Stieleria maiorica TaxID=2795974 RepID=UPI0011C8B5A2|nr:cytochrome c [Stieleria maiorica]
MSTEHLPNAIRIHPRVISGGLPAGGAGFRELRRLGVETVISVDGARPDVELAREHGLRYVHLPHGYDGVPEQRVRELAKAVRQLDGPVYLHCHHGKHRSPAAASVACVAAGLIPKSQSVKVLQLAGTSPHYRGLYQAARDVDRIDHDLLDALEVRFQASVDVPPMAEAMVSLEQSHHHLQKIAAADWKSPPDHPDLDPPHQALLLREHFTELLRTEATQQESDAFIQIMRHSEETARSLEKTLRRWDAAMTPQPPAALNQQLRQITSDCKSCHQRFRDVPLSEK